MVNVIVKCNMKIVNYLGTFNSLVPGVHEKVTHN